MRFVISLLVLLSACATTTPTVTKRYAQINGMNLYYEVHGSGPDVVLIHGSFCTIEGCFGKLLPELAKNHRVIAFEMQAHGRTADIDRPMTISNLAGDALALMDTLGVKKADLLGYSMGSTVALELALTHPERVKKLVMLTAAFSPDGVKPRAPAQLADFEGTPMLTEYQRIAPRPDQFPRLVQRVNEADVFKAQSPDAIRRSAIPMLIIYADDDLVTPEHEAAFKELLDARTSKLDVIPNTTHGTLVEKSEQLSPLIDAFLR
ncbi:MAG: alpha/beta fold hydrolase [Archangium sp.]